MIGLKHFKSKVEGSGLRHKISTLKYELKYAWQRAWRGYDDVFCFSMDSSFVALYKEAMKDFRNNLHSYPANMTEEEWDEVLDTMIILLSKMNLDDNYELSLLAKDEFFKLFGEYFYDMWD